MVRFLVLFLLIQNSFGDEHDHIYEADEEVVLWMNTIGPYRNRQETYPFYDLPFCRGPKRSIEHAHETLGEALQGTELQYSGIDIRFKVDQPKATVCTLHVAQAIHDRLKSAIIDQYWYQMYLDNLPIWSIVGELSVDNLPYLWTHMELELGYNGNQIVKVALTNSEMKPLKPDGTINFTYSVKWLPSTISFENRFDEYLDYKFFQHTVHWFSIFNSFMMMAFLITLVGVILCRTLRRDYARYSKDESLSDLDKELGDEYGWKQVHGDVFRAPPYPSLLASLVGSGAHIAVVALVVLVLAFCNRLYTDRGGVVSIAILMFAITSPVNGFVGGALYAHLSGKRWIRQFLLGSTLLPTVISCAVLFVNTIAVYYHTTRSIPPVTMFMMVCIVMFVVVPLNLVGTVLGRNTCGQASYPCRVNAVPRPMPEKKWFMEPAFIILVSGVLPFGSIFIELYFVFSSFWAYKIYFVFGFAILVFLLLVAVTSSISAVGTYFLLNAEDYRWQWTSFCAGASIFVYAYCYSMYYFLFKTKMSGVFQTAFFFSYMALFCLCLGVMCGAVAYLAANQFVRKIYGIIKVD